MEFLNNLWGLGTARLHGPAELILGIDSWALSEPVFLNVYGAQESIPRNEFRQPM
jgi:hypothetical protein